jgi:uncharacterized protein (TIGR00251 family)
VIQASKRGNRILLPVKVQPGAKRCAILGEHNGRLKVAIQAPADRGRANRELLKLLAAELETRCSLLSIVHGETSRDKLIAIDPQEMSSLLAALARIGIVIDEQSSARISLP